jgi:DNA polymerase-4
VIAGRDRDLGPRVPRILHLDIDAFLASVEQAVHPELQGLPVVIGGAPTDRNLVMSCSYAVRAFGVRPGMLLPEAARRCPQAIFRRGDSQAANRLREQAAAILLRSTPKVEIASIDDFFADLAGTARLEGSACDAGFP